MEQLPVSPSSYTLEIITVFSASMSVTILDTLYKWSHICVFFKIPFLLFLLVSFHLFSFLYLDIMSEPGLGLNLALKGLFN